MNLVAVARLARKGWVDAEPGMIFRSGSTEYVILGAFTDAGKTVIGYTDRNPKDPRSLEIWADSFLWELNKGIATWVEWSRND